MKFYCLAFFTSLLFLTCFPCTSHAGNTGFPSDSSRLLAKPDSFRYHYFTGEIFQKASRKDIYTLHDFEVYDHRNYLGNIGQAINEYSADQPLGHTGFTYFKNDFARNLLSDDSVRYFDTHHPYTKLFFLAGQKKEAKFNFTHSQNVNKNLNFTAYFNRIRSDGTYLRQATNLTSIYLSSNYKSPNRRYYLLGNVVYNVDKPQVNGGIKADSSLESNVQPIDKKLIPVNLYGAQRTYRNRSIFLKQFFNMGYNTLPADSFQKPVFIPTSAFSASIHVSDEAIAYVDSLVDAKRFYRNNYSTQTIYRDSVYLYRIQSAVGWNNWEQKRGGGNRKLRAFASIENEVIRLKQTAVVDTAFLNWTARGGLFTSPDTGSVFGFRLNGEYVWSGYNKGDYRAEASLEKPFFRKKMILKVNAGTTLLKPDYLSLICNSTNFIWKNQFLSEGSQKGKITLVFPAWFLEAGAFVQNFDHHVFFDAQAYPQQLTPSCSVSGAYISKELNLGSWCLVNRITYQYSSDQGVLPFPEWITKHSLYFHHAIKNTLFYQIGINVTYFSSYYSQYYMPATGQFVLQFDKKIGNYPFTDLYLSMQIRTVRLFITYEHINSGYPSNSYYLAPHYPAPDRAMKLGVSWIFNN